MHDSEILSAIAHEYATRGDWRAAQHALQVAVDAGEAGIQVRFLIKQQGWGGGEGFVCSIHHGSWQPAMQGAWHPGALCGGQERAAVGGE
jgi:hypothetical protein